MIRYFQFALATVGLAIVALLSAIATMHFAIHGAEVTIPDLRGMTVAEATHKAVVLGVNLTVDNRFYSAEVPADRIISQSPAPGTPVRREWHVRVAASLGPQKVSIPNVTGEEERIATLKIRRLGLDIGTMARMPYATAAPGTVIAQNPAPDAAGVERPTVGLVVAEETPSEPSAFVMPDLSGQTAIAASAAVTRAGLKMAAWKDVEVAIPSAQSPTAANTAQPAAAPAQPMRPMAAPGTVIGQKPLPGYRVDANTPVELTVAR